MKSRLVVYPFLIAAFPILGLYAQNAREIPPRELALPLAAAVGATSLAWGALRLLLRDAHRAGLIAAMGVAVFATVAAAPGAVAEGLSLLSGLWVGHRYEAWPATVVGLELGLFAGLSYLAARRLKTPDGWTPALNLFATVLVAFPATSIVRARAGVAARPAQAMPTLASLPTTGRRPDIYYIILDGFARGDVLASTFGYDLEPFLRRLEGRGFYVPRRSTANYCQTPLSIASSLNGAYHEPATSETNAGMPPDPVLFRHNAVVASLAPLGYRFVTFSSGFDFTEYPGADVYLSPYFHLTDFQRMLAEGTPLAGLLPGLIDRDSYTMTRERTLYLFDHLPDVARIAGPTFTFAHVLSPHPPFTFGPDGEDVSPHHKPYFLSDGSVYRGAYGDAASYVGGYRKQVAFLVKRVEATIDRILAESPEPPIIVLQSDHGSGLNLDMESAQRTDHAERMSILNAYYLPGGGREGLHDRITPVNSFRAVFRNEFGARLDPLPEENYYSTWSQPFGFVRVTDRVDAPRVPARAE